MDLPVTTDREARVTLGVDADAHFGVALNKRVRRLGSKFVPATQEGYAELVVWVKASARGSPGSCAKGAWRSSR